VLQAASVPTIAESPRWRNTPDENHDLTMTLLLLEALGALLLLVFIVWWTMFSGRRKGELPSEDHRDHREAPAETKPPEGR
jgi:hypothetical protein